MGIVLLVGAPDLSEPLRARGSRVLECAAPAGLDRALRGADDQVDAVVIGANVENPIQSTQRAYRLDASVAVVLLAAADQCPKLRGALRFSPFIGPDVVCNDVSASDLPSAIESAAARTRARRSHRATVVALDAQLRRPRKGPSSSQSLSPRELVAAQLLDIAPIGIVSLDREGKVVAANIEATRLFGSSERAMIGGRLADVLGEDALEWNALLDRAGNDRATATFRLSAGAPRVLEASAVVVSGGDGFLVVLQDMTERVRAAEAREIALHTAEEANRLKDEFVAMVSHELRTPLNALLGWTRLLRGGSVRTEKVPHALEVIERNAETQARLVEDLLDVSRIIAGKMRLDVRPTDVRRVIVQAAESVQVAAGAKQLSLTIDVEDGLPELNADAERLQQIVSNLLGNAVKFTPRHGAVRVHARRAGSSIEISISDDGEGIAPDALPYIFDPFRQARGGMTRAHGGLGLGLAIVRRLVELHGGRVTAESDGVGRGAKFSIDLPIQPLKIHAVDQDDVAAAARTTIGGLKDDGNELSTASVLVVDDDVDARELVATLVEGAGGRAHVAGSSREALDVLARARIDVIVADIGMPEEDGYTFIDHVRRTAPIARTPALALTAYSREQERARALAAGFDEHAGKPISPAELVSIIARLLTRRDA